MRNLLTEFRQFILRGNPPLPLPPPRAGRHRPVPGQMRTAEAGDQAGRIRPGRALAAIPASRPATASSGG